MVQINRFVLFTLMFLFLFSYVSAVRVDYSPNDKGIKDMKAVVKDTILFGLISVGEQGTMELKSHDTIYEKRGVEINTLTKKVNPAGIGLIYETNFGNEHKDALTDVKIIDMKTGKEVERDWRFVYSSDGQWEIPIYKEVCSKEEQLKEEYERNCDWIFDYYEYSPRKIWNVYDNNNIPKGKFELGIEIEVKEGDYLDIILEVQGKGIDKHAQVIEGIAGYIYTAGAGNQSVVKYDSDFNIVAVSPNYGGQIISLSLDDDYVYYGGTASTIRKAYKTNLTTITDSPNYGGDIYSISLDDDYVYYGGTASTIRKAYKTNLTTITDSPNYGGVIRSISLDDDYVYYGGYTTQTIRKAYKTNLATITDSPNYGGVILSISLDDDYVYYGGDTTRKVRKAYKSDLTTITDSPNYGGDIYSISLDDDYVYYGGYTTQTIRKAYKTNLATITDSPNYGGVILSISLDDDYVYYGGHYTQTVRKAYKTNLTTITDGPNYGGAIWSISLEASLGLEISLISPIDYYNSSSQTIDFSANLTDEGNIGIQNVSLVINDTIYDTNTSGLTGIYNFSETLSDGFYKWYVKTYDDTDKLYESETRYFTIDTLAPSIEILSPVTSYNYLKPNQTIDLNVSITDASDHLDSCWYEYNSSIISFNCSENQTFNYIPDQNTLTVYANDTFGNEKNESVSWGYKVLQGSIIYDNISYEGLDSSFYNFITLNGAIQGAYLEYGNTNYTSSIYLNNNTFLYNQISLPNIESDVNNTFFWWIKIGDEWFQTISNVQLVKAMEVTNCTTSTLLSLNLKDEKLQTSLNGTLEVLLNVISQSGTEVFVYNNTFTNKNNVQFCLSPVDLDKSLFRFNAQIKYSSTDYASELYNIQDAGLSDYPQNLSLYDLANNQSTKFKITYKGSDFIPKEGVLVQLLRKYIGGDSYKVVEAPITSSLGEVILHIDQDTNLYNIIISRDGEVLDTYENIVFTCDTALVGLCTFDLDGVINPYNEISTDILNDITFQITELNDTNVMVTFSSISGTPVNVRLLVKKNSIIGESYIYNNSLYSSAGSFNVILNDDTNMGIGENVYLFTFIKDDEVIGTKSFLLNNASMGWDNNNYFIVVILLLSVVGMAFTSPELVIFNAVLTFLIAGSLWLLNGMSFAVGLGSLIWLVIASGILIFKLSHQEDR